MIDPLGRAWNIPALSRVLLMATYHTPRRCRSRLPTVRARTAVVGRALHNQI